MKENKMAFNLMFPEFQSVSHTASALLTAKRDALD
jgi:hypothetical protein